jgi:5S rRNA maturation endonuclease (ribonuclease M5)
MLAGVRAIGCDPEETKAGSGVYWLRCPHPDHLDNRPSAQLQPGTKGAPWVLHCYSCAPSRGTDARARWTREVAEAVSQRVSKPAPPEGTTKKARRGSSGGPLGRPVAEYMYRRVDRTVVARKVRYEDDAGGKSFGWWRPYGDTWASKLGRMKEHELPLYGVVLLDRPGPVYVVEGEKDVQRLEQLGVPAVSAAGGAHGPLPDDLEPLRGRDVIIVADRDDPGIALAWRWRDRLAEVAASIRLARSATTGNGDDVSDHLDAGHSLDALDLGDLPEAGDTGTGEGETHHGRRLVLTPAASIAPMRARWLWSGRLAVGTLAILAGREGVGKSTLAYWIAASVTRGTLPGELNGTPAAVLVAATEDSWAHTIVPRLIAAGADLTRVYRVEVCTDLGGSELSLPTDVTGVGEAAGAVGAALLLLDPLMSRLSAKLDTHKDQETRQALEPLTKMLDQTRMVGLGLMHFNKRGTDDPLDALMASRAFSAVARSVSTVVRDPDDDDGRRRLFGTPKNNLGPDDLPLLSFTLESCAVPTDEGDAITSRIVWGDEVADTITDVLRRTNDGGDRTATAEAADWLSDYLSQQGGQADSATIKKAGHGAGHSADALHRARKRLGLVTSSAGFPRRTVWELPQSSALSSGASRGSPGETHATATTATTATTDASRGSRRSRGTQEEPATTVDLGLIRSCSACARPTVSNPCRDCDAAS